MTTQTRAYQHPDSGTLSAAADAALAAHSEAADRIARVMTVVTAAGVRDGLTGCDPDATHLELTEGYDGDLWATGRYWTADGAERTFAEHAADGAGAGIVHVWHPLCTELPDRDGRPAYRLDLTKAAGMPLD
ncbi:hypothetical protein ACFYY2_31510 [Streptomyces sp. NPDC001822]|uniref:hypothetical protein n=1 Tax=Streptomyces sp. NPDC001822 TaxID=3364614 RepID=UPI003690388B